MLTADIAAFGSALATTAAPASCRTTARIAEASRTTCGNTYSSDAAARRAAINSSTVPIGFLQTIVRRRFRAALMDFFRAASSRDTGLLVLTSTISGFSYLTVTAPLEKSVRGGAFQSVGRAKPTNGSGESVWSRSYISLYPVACRRPFQMVRRFQHHDVDSVSHLVHRVTVIVPFAIDSHSLDHVDAKPEHRAIFQSHPSGGFTYVRDVHHLSVDGLPRARVIDASCSHVSSRRVSQMTVIVHSTRCGRGATPVHARPWQTNAQYRLGRVDEQRRHDIPLTGDTLTIRTDMNEERFRAE